MHTCKCVVACAASVSWPQSVSPLVSFLNQNHWLKPTSLQTGWREIERLTSAAEACSEKFWMDGWKDGDRGFKEIALFFPDCGFFFFFCHLMPSWINPWGESVAALCQGMEANTHTEILRGILEMLQDAKPLWAWVCVQPCSLAPCNSSTTPYTHMCMRVCVSVDHGAGGCCEQGRNAAGSSPLAEREGRQRREGRWGSWWGFKGFLHSWALFVTEHNPALHFNKSTEVKKLHSGENKMDVDWLSFSLCLMGSVDLCPHVSARLPTVLKCSVSQFILP